MSDKIVLRPMLDFSIFPRWEIVLIEMWKIILALPFFLWNWAVNSGKYASYAFHMPFRGDEEASDFMKRITPNSIMPFGII